MIRKICCAFAAASLLAGCVGTKPQAQPQTETPPPPTTAPSAKVFDIPRLDSVQVDGKPDDWGDDGFRVDAMASIDGFESPASEFNSRFRVGWNQTGLLALVRVHNSAIAEMNNPELLWQGDSVELCVASAIGSADHYQLIISPGVDAKHNEVRTHIADSRKTPSLKSQPINPVIKRTKIEDGYVIQTLLPWSTLGIEPKAGATVALQVVVDTQRHDTDGGGGSLRVPWYPSLESVFHTEQSYTVRLSDHASPPVQMAASGGYARLRRLHIDVVTDAALAGQEIHVVSPDGTKATATIDAQKLNSVTTLQLALPTPQEIPPANALGTSGLAAAKCVVSVGDQKVEFPALRELAQARFAAFRHEKLAAQNFVFVWSTFPKIDFERPAEAEDVIGDYHLKTTFYDADFHPVKSADKPGRYGAVVELSNAAGLVERRYLTLFRAPRPFDWRGLIDSAAAEFPDELGLDKAVLGEQQQTISEGLRQMLGNAQGREQSFAILFAGLFETRPGETGALRQSPARRDDVWWTQLKKSLGQFQAYPTIVHLPPGYMANGGKHWPLILFLHGSDPHSDDPEVIRKQGLCEYAIEHPEFPFVVISPTTPPGQWFSPGNLSSLLDDALKQYDVDPDRVYLTGLSLGGYGTWDLAAMSPDRFAAAVPIAGIGDPSDADRLKNLPMWVFHGEVDPTVPIAPDRQCVDALLAVGARVKFTTYPFVGHNSWTQTYNNPALYTWLLEQRRGAPAQAPATRPATTQPAHLLAAQPLRGTP